MIKPNVERLRGLALAMIAVALLLPLVACADESADVTEDTGTALSNLAAAESAAAALAPDVKLLVLQTGGMAQVGSDPVWVFTFGSPETGAMYTVSIAGGNVMDASEAGQAPLEDDEWDVVPDTAAWDIDSHEAYESALAVSGANGDPAGYSMLLETHVPRSSSAEPVVRPFVWYVAFEPGSSGATAGVIEVDAKTGEASLVE